MANDDAHQTAERPRNPAWDGMDARRAGMPVEKCPYDDLGPQRTAWVIGWYIAAPEKSSDGL